MIFDVKYRPPEWIACYRAVLGPELCTVCPRVRRHHNPDCFCRSLVGLPRMLLKGLPLISTTSYSLCGK